MNTVNTNNSWLLSDTQSKLIRLATTYHTLTACGYAASAALSAISSAYGLTRTELQWLISHLGLTPAPEATE